MSLPSVHSSAQSASSRSAYWEHSRDHKGAVQHKAPVFDDNDPVTWLRLMQQHLRMTGMGDTITRDAVFGGYRLRAGPSDTTSNSVSWEEINASSSLTSEETAAFVRCTDAFAILTQALSTAPTAYKQIAVTVEDGNTKVLWSAIKRHVEETRGETGTRLLSKLVSAQMKSDETPLQYGIRLQADLTSVRAHGKDVDEDLLKDRFVNFMTASYADTARHLALLKKRSSLAELIEAAAEIGAVQAATTSTSNRSGGNGDRRSTHHANAGETLRKGCYKCGAHDHIKQNCPQVKDGNGTTNNNSGRSGSGSQVTCEVCRRTGHTVDKCYTMQRAEKMIRDRSGAQSSTTTTTPKKNE